MKNFEYKNWLDPLFNSFQNYFGMPPKKDATSNSGNNFLVHAEEDKILQAVVISDSFNERFMPITLDKPRVQEKWGLNTLISYISCPLVHSAFFR